MIVQLADVGQRRIELAHHGLFVLMADIGGVAAHFIAHLQQLFLGPGNGLELTEAARITFGQRQHRLVEFIDQGNRGLGLTPHLLTRPVAGIVGTAHLGQ
ncbi:hypothetical protein D3C76_810550 [compost metagenome]